jgi:hypothetical protein
MSNTRKSLPDGTWFTLCGLPSDATENTVQELFHHRTGVYIEPERIQVNDTVPGKRQLTAIISLSKKNLAEILAWGFQDDRPDGTPLSFLVPDGRKEQRR